MTVKELIELLKQYPGDALVAYEKYSEQCLMEKDKVLLKEAGKPRPDGWVPDKRPNTGSQIYVMFPGN